MLKFEGNRLLIATHNPHKVPEIAALLPTGITYLTCKDLNLPEPDETGTTFEENAIIKAVAAATASGEIALADDSGLCVNALGGAPGVYSANWAGPNRDFTAARRRIHNELGDNPDRSAHFVSVLALAWPDGKIITVEGRVNGQIIWPERGNTDFGFDAIFQPNDYQQTFGEMPPELKQKISHRAIAFANLREIAF